MLFFSTNSSNIAFDKLLFISCGQQQTVGSILLGYEDTWNGSYRLYLVQVWWWTETVSAMSDLKTPKLSYSIFTESSIRPGTCRRYMKQNFTCNSSNKDYFEILSKITSCGIVAVQLVQDFCWELVDGVYCHIRFRRALCIRFIWSSCERISWGWKLLANKSHISWDNKIVLSPDSLEFFMIRTHLHLSLNLHQEVLKNFSKKLPSSTRNWTHNSDHD